MENDNKMARFTPSRCVAAFACALVMVWLGLLTWQVQTPAMPVSFDLRATVDAFTVQTAERHLSDDEKARLAARFNDALDNALREWSETHHRPVLVKGAVVLGAEDITADIQREIARRMRGGDS